MSFENYFDDILIFLICMFLLVFSLCFHIEKWLFTRFPGFSDFKVVFVELLAMAWNMITWDLLDCRLVVGFVL